VSSEQGAIVGILAQGSRPYNICRFSMTSMQHGMMTLILCVVTVLATACGMRGRDAPRHCDRWTEAERQDLSEETVGMLIWMRAQAWWSAPRPTYHANMVAEHGGSTGQSCSSCGSSSRPSRSRSSTLGVPGGELRLCCSRRPEKQSGEEQRQREMHNGLSGRGILDRNLQERAHSLADRRAWARRARRRA